MQTRFDEPNTFQNMKPFMSLTHLHFVQAQSSDTQDDSNVVGHALAVVETAKPELKRPQRYQVVILNDDYTPMEFVIEVLLRFFGLNADAATQLMLKVHHHGRAGVGNYSRDVAETKATLVVDYAQQNGHPLLCQAEPML